MSTGSGIAFFPRAKGRPWLRNGAIAAAVLSLAGLFVNHERAWSGYLLGFAAVSGFSLGGTFFLAAVHVARARWASGLKPVAQAMAATTPLAAVLGLGLLAGMPSLYEWTRPSEIHSHGIEQKLWYLNPAFFSLRTIAYFAIWVWLGSRLLGASRRSDGEPAMAGRAYRLGIAYIAVFAATFSLASWDWYLSLEAEWFSTIYTLLVLAGILTGGLGLVMVAAVALRNRCGSRSRISIDALDDLGKIGIGAAMFWGYIGYCQSMLIWYTNMPEETGWYVARQGGGWPAILAVSLILNGAIPFLCLMPRAARRSPAVIFRIGLVFLAGRLADLYYLIGPPLMPEGPVIGVFELAPLAAACILFAMVFVAAIQDRGGALDGPDVRAES